MGALAYAYPPPAPAAVSAPAPEPVGAISQRRSSHSSGQQGFPLSRSLAQQHQQQQLPTPQNRYYDNFLDEPTSAYELGDDYNNGGSNSYYNSSDGLPPTQAAAPRAISRGRASVSNISGIGNAVIGGIRRSSYTEEPTPAPTSGSSYGAKSATATSISMQKSLVCI